MGLSDERKRLQLDQDFGSGTPTSWYWGLSRTKPNEDGTGASEPVGFSYARVLQANNVTNFPAAVTVGGETYKLNGVNVVFPNPTGDWGLCTYWVLYLASSGGIAQWWNPFDGDGVRPKNGLSPVQIDAGFAKLQVA